MIVGEPQDQRIVDDSAVLVDDRRVLALSDGAPSDVARGHQLRQGERVAAANLDLTLHRDVPELNAFEEMPVVRLQRFVHHRQQHVIVDAERPHPRRENPIVERRRAQPRGDGESVGSGHSRSS